MISVLQNSESSQLVEFLTKRFQKMVEFGEKMEMTTKKTRKMMKITEIINSTIFSTPNFKNPKVENVIEANIQLSNYSGVFLKKNATVASKIEATVNSTENLELISEIVFQFIAEFALNMTNNFNENLEMILTGNGTTLVMLAQTENFTIIPIDDETVEAAMETMTS